MDKLMRKINDHENAYVSKKLMLDGVQYIVKFKNGYGASVIRNTMSYGYENGLFELAVLKVENDRWELCYDTEITDDVIGWQTVEDVAKLLEQIMELPEGA